MDPAPDTNLVARLATIPRAFPLTIFVAKEAFESGLIILLPES
jgi:hypothetical protein